MAALNQLFTSQSLFGMALGFGMRPKVISWHYTTTITTTQATTTLQILLPNNKMAKTQSLHHRTLEILYTYPSIYIYIRSYTMLINWKRFLVRIEYLHTQWPGFALMTSKNLLNCLCYWPQRKMCLYTYIVYIILMHSHI